MADKTKNASKFQDWYAGHAASLGLDPDPDDPRHFYDWRAAYKAGAAPDASGHWPSEFKREGHPRMIIDGVNTKTGERAMGFPERTALGRSPWGGATAGAEGAAGTTPQMQQYMSREITPEESERQQDARFAAGEHVKLKREDPLSKLAAMIPKGKREKAEFLRQLQDEAEARGMMRALGQFRGQAMPGGMPPSMVAESGMYEQAPVIAGGMPPSLAAESGMVPGAPQQWGNPEFQRMLEQEAATRGTMLVRGGSRR